ncbi:universal stress protein [Microbacterium awajiense]|uniref:Universal stress protein n=1 Tax=Microbacterium awajiense TaxID=415214 RepID=A0ABP7AWI0_9MICO
MQNIVVGYDESAAARSALEWVADRCADRTCTVVLAMVTSALAPAGDHSKNRLALHEAERRVRDRSPGSHVESHRVGGTMPKALVMEADHADLLAIGVHRGRPIRTALGGWMPSRVIARADTPVCLVPDDWSASDEPVTVGVDDDASSDAALMFAAREAEAGGGRLRIVHAWSMPTPTMEGAVALLASPLQVKEGHRQILRDAVRRVRQARPTLDIEERLIAAPPGGALCAEGPRSSMVVIGTHRRGVLEAGLIGSVARDVIGEVDIPVCVVPPVTAQ